MNTEIRQRFWNRILFGFGAENFRFKASLLQQADPKPMEELGILVPSAPELYSSCPRCEYDVKVKIMRDESGKKGYYRVCCGRTKRVSSKNFRVWKLCADPVIELFRKEVGIKGGLQEVVPHRIWKLGRRGQISFVYINHVTEDDMKPFFSILSRFSNTIFVAPLNFALERLQILLPNQGVAWSDVSWLDENYAIHFDMEKIKTVLIPETTAKPKPPARRGKRSVNIEKLVHELRQHLISAWDHYWEMGNLLPKPRMEDLGKLIGIEKYAVSRCFNDPDADKLRFLWKHADDIKFIQNWKG